MCEKWVVYISMYMIIISNIKIKIHWKKYENHAIPLLIPTIVMLVSGYNLPFDFIREVVMMESNAQNQALFIFKGQKEKKIIIFFSHSAFFQSLIRIFIVHSLLHSSFTSSFINSSPCSLSGFLLSVYFLHFLSLNNSIIFLRERNRYHGVIYLKFNMNNCTPP